MLRFLEPHDHLSPQSGDFERQLWSLMFLSLNQRDEESWPPPLDPRSLLWKSEFKLPDECDQEHVHLNHAAKVMGELKRQPFAEESMSDYARKSPSDAGSNAS